MMGMMVVQGPTGGSFSPIGIFGAITNGVVDKSQLPGSPAVLFFSAMGACALISLVAFLTMGGVKLVRRDRESPEVPVPALARIGGSGGDGEGEPSGQDLPRLDAQRALTLVGLAVLAVGAPVFDLDIGFLALAVAVALTLIFPSAARGTVDKISWGTVLLVGGIVTYVSLLQDQGTVKWLGDGVAQVGTPLLAALLICLIGAVVSAFASTTGILGALIPLAVPFLQTGQVGAVGLITALAISSSVVDCSPFSTNGALVVANSDVADRDDVFKRLMTWGMTIVVAAPVLSWAIFVVPGSLS